jgi:TatD DNase family protein
LFTIGIHPSSTAGKPALDTIERFTEQVMKSENSDLLFGIGETGLDYFRMRRPKEEQKNSFEHQIQLAQKYRLPVIVHSRNASDESLAILQKYAPVKGIMHCFSDGADYAKKFLDLGMHLSFAGNVTYKAAIKLQESAAYAPLDRLLIETDAPFLTPVPLRGKKNRPEFVVHTYKFIAQLRGISEEKLVHEINDNFQSFLNNKT